MSSRDQGKDPKDPVGGLSSLVADLKVSTPQAGDDSDEDLLDPDILYSNTAGLGAADEKGYDSRIVGSAEGKGHKQAQHQSPQHKHSAALSLNLNSADSKSSGNFLGTNPSQTISRALEQADEHIAEQERSVNVVFDFEDGSQGEGTFKLGHSVEFLKSYVESEYGIPIPEQIMYLDDTKMLDPLSLLDYPQAKTISEMYIRVVGDLPSDSKK